MGLAQLNPVTRKSVDLFILAGQSNMQGYAGNALKYPIGNTHEDLSIKFYYVEPLLSEHKLIRVAADNTINIGAPGSYSWLKNELSRSWGDFRRRFNHKINTPPPAVQRRTWTFLGPQSGRFPNGHFGPEISFARKLLESGFNPAIFKYSKESTSLAEDWQGPNQNGIYDDFVYSLNNAITDLKNQGYNINIRGLIWLQGENDALTDDAARLYLSRLKIIIADLREKILPLNTPIILGADELHPHMLTHPQVKAAQESMAATDSCIIRSSMEGLEKADFTHLTPQAITEHGLRLFTSYLKLALICQNQNP
jgi:hypothetical protein